MEFNIRKYKPPSTIPRIVNHSFISRMFRSYNALNTREDKLNREIDKINKEIDKIKKVRYDWDKIKNRMERKMGKPSKMKKVLQTLSNISDDDNVNRPITRLQLKKTKKK